MDQLIPVVGTMALLGSALVGGIFFAFSSFVMKALARVSSAEGIGAMQSINVVVLNPSFLGTFLFTALGNVPLNDQLAAVSATDPTARDEWEHYLGRWTMWNHVRTAAAMVAALLYSLGLMQNGGT